MKYYFEVYMDPRNQMAGSYRLPYLEVYNVVLFLAEQNPRTSDYRHVKLLECHVPNGVPFAYMNGFFLLSKAGKYLHFSRFPNPVDPFDSIVPVRTGWTRATMNSAGHVLRLLSVFKGYNATSAGILNDAFNTALTRETLASLLNAATFERSGGSLL